MAYTLARPSVGRRTIQKGGLVGLPFLVRFARTHPGPSVRIRETRCAIRDVDNRTLDLLDSIWHGIAWDNVRVGPTGARKGFTRSRDSSMGGLHLLLSIQMSGTPNPLPDPASPSVTVPAGAGRAP